MTAAPKIRLTREEYLELERSAEYKSEYYAGKMYAMSGASLAHNILVANLIFVLKSHFSATKRNCLVLPSDMRLYVPVRKHFYTYPDVMIVCGKPELDDERKDILKNPLLIAEVLSPSTAEYDRGKKFEFYRMLSGLKEYVLIEQERPSVEVFTRSEGDEWRYRAAAGATGEIRLDSVDYNLLLGELYDRIEFPPEEEYEGKA